MTNLCKVFPLSLGLALALALALQAWPASSSPLQSLHSPAPAADMTELIESALDAKHLLTAHPAAVPRVLAIYSVKPTAARLAQRLLPSGLPLLAISHVTSPFGIRFHPISQLLRPHTGVDLSAQPGTEVLSTAGGVVEKVDTVGHSTYGKYIVLRHSFGFSTRYAHLQEVRVSVGDPVTVRQTIGLSGNSGLSNGPHLHYEVRYLGKPVDPQPFIKDAPEKARGLETSGPQRS